MTARYSIADVASIIGEPARAAILLALLDGRALPAGELAAIAELSKSAASLHLAKLANGGLVAMQREGRHRYFRIASAEVAHALEALGAIATRSPPPASRPLSPERAALKMARTCYDHLAGEVAVALAAQLEREHVLAPAGERDYDVTRNGARWLERALGVDIRALHASRRALARRCLDWTERKPHVAGALGAAILDRLLGARWIVRTKSTRAVRVTPRGRTEFARIGLPL